MNRARDAILARVRQAEKTALLPRAPAGTPRHLQFQIRPPGQSLERFLQETSALGIETFVEDTPDAVRNRVKALVTGRRVFSWDPELLPYALGSGLRNLALSDLVLSKDPREKQASAEIGLTGCDAAIAETGSLVVLSGHGKSRAVSLLPPVHIALVQLGDLYFSMSEFFEKNSAKLKAASSCSVITGPSRTADIELTLIVGVHGPGRVIIVVGP